jgi:hypothetical protein
LNEFVGIGDCVLGVSPPILGVPLFLATGLPIRRTGFKEFDASWLDVAVKVSPGFDDHLSAPSALGIGPWTTTSARFAH